jgi:dolichol-phosphate mannosyltransferase
MSISFIIPTINERENISKAINFIFIVMNKLELDAEILFVDDQSTDGTVDIIKKYVKKDSRIKIITPPKRLGLGFALYCGMRMSKKKYILFLDCDLSVNKKDLEKILLKRDQGSMVIGSRYLKKSNIINAPIIKVFLSRALNYFVGKITGLQVRDISHSLRIFKNDVNFNPRSYTHPAFLWDLTLNYFDAGKTIKEIPITFTERRIGVTKNKTLKMIKSVPQGLLIVFAFIKNRWHF